MTKNFAHRGFSARYPENTMLAFRKAIEAGCDGIELDVHLSRDGYLAVIHDENVRRTTNGAGLVKDMTLDDLRRLDAGSNERIPTLEEYFDMVETLSVITNIELKNNSIWYQGMEEKLVETVRRRHMEDRVIFSSFNHYSILKCKALAPEIRCGFLYNCWIINAGAYAREHGVECVHPEHHSLTADILAEMRENNIAVNTWTVNDREDMERLLRLNVDSIITNEPALLAGVLGGR